MLMMKNYSRNESFIIRYDYGGEQRVKYVGTFCGMPFGDVSSNSRDPSKPAKQTQVTTSCVDEIHGLLGGTHHSYT